MATQFGGRPVVTTDAQGVVGAGVVVPKDRVTGTVAALSISGSTLTATSPDGSKSSVTLPATSGTSDPVSTADFTALITN